MSALTIDAAARKCRRDPRELRELIESGELAASRRDGRWIIDRADLERLTSPSSPPARALEPPERQAFGELFARVRTLSEELSGLRAQLDRVEGRLAKLEGAAPRPFTREPTMRDALHPLFGRTDPSEREPRR